MVRKLLIAAGATLLFASPSFAATACKDTHGKFIKCPPAAAAPAKPTAVVAVKAAPCKDAHGKFTKCAAAPAPSATVAVKTKVKTTTTTTGAPRCRNAKGQFAKCGTPGAKPA